MRRILRRYVVRDRLGRPISVRSERLTDDGEHVHLSAEQQARPCGGCGRYLTEVSMLRGVCDCCGIRECCDHCIRHCQVCQRQLCGRCRQGFAGPPPVTVCASCREQLRQRRQFDDHRAAMQAAFDRHMEQQRLVNQSDRFNLDSVRTRASLQLQAARLGLRPSTTPLWRRALGLTGHAVSKVFRHARRLLP